MVFFSGRGGRGAGGIDEGKAMDSRHSTSARFAYTRLPFFCTFLSLLCGVRHRLKTFSNSYAFPASRWLHILFGGTRWQFSVPRKKVTRIYWILRTGLSV